MGWNTVRIPSDSSRRAISPRRWWALACWRARSRTAVHGHFEEALQPGGGGHRGAQADDADAPLRARFVLEERDELHLQALGHRRIPEAWSLPRRRGQHHHGGPAPLHCHLEEAHRPDAADDGAVHRFAEQARRGRRVHRGHEGRGLQAQPAGVHHHVAPRRPGSPRRGSWTPLGGDRGSGGVEGSGAGHRGEGRGWLGGPCAATRLVTGRVAHGGREGSDAGRGARHPPWRPTRMPPAPGSRHRPPARAVGRPCSQAPGSLGSAVGNGNKSLSRGTQWCGGRREAGRQGSTPRRDPVIMSHWRWYCACAARGGRREVVGQFRRKFGRSLRSPRVQWGRRL